jgi:hypothetical protein|tara:strand:- start:522 stop:782 length:261 start_codon:yes stop_codon:yes gene_type:complete
MYVCRNASSKVVRFVTTTGVISINETELISVSAEEFSGSQEGWGTSDGFELVNLTGLESAVIPDDYTGDAYKLLDDGSGGYSWLKI